MGDRFCGCASLSCSYQIYPLITAVLLPELGGGEEIVIPKLFPYPASPALSVTVHKYNLLGRSNEQDALAHSTGWLRSWSYVLRARDTRVDSPVSPRPALDPQSTRLILRCVGTTLLTSIATQRQRSLASTSVPSSQIGCPRTASSSSTTLQIVGSTKTTISTSCIFGVFSGALQIGEHYINRSTRRPNLAGGYRSWR